MKEAGRAQRLLAELEEHHRVRKCTECECLQGALMQLLLERPDMEADIRRLVTKTFHRCLGCKPCPPADAWQRYLKEG